MGIEIPNDTRQTYEFTLDDGDEIQAMTIDAPPLKSIGLVKLYPSEEVKAAERSNGNQVKLGFEIIKFSLRSINGQRVNAHDGSAEKAMSDYGTQGRELIADAYRDITTLKEGVAARFLKSRTVKSG